MRATRSLAAVLLAAACGAGPAVAFGATRTTASRLPGAPHTWLPDEDWVTRHWVPFDERAPDRAPGACAAGELEAYLYDDHRALSDLALARGLDVAQLRDELVAPWRAPVDDARYELLRERTQRVLTQPHLAQHVFFHLFHGAALDDDPVHGLRAARRGRSGRCASTGSRRSRSPHGAACAPLAPGHAVPPPPRRCRGQASAWAWPGRRRRIASSPGRPPGSTAGCGARRPGNDPANPYGKARFWHGAHARAVARHEAATRERTSDASSGSAARCGGAAGRSRSAGAGPPTG